MKIGILLVVVVACSSGQHSAASSGAASGGAPSGSAPSGSAPSGNTPSGSAASGGSESSPPPAGCPATFATATGHCTMKQDPCMYSDGSCICGEAPWCGGAAPPPPNPATFTWQCTPNVRADGCPGHAPGDGMACTREGQNCDYTCSCSEIARCTSGRWKIEHGPCKP